MRNWRIQIGSDANTPCFYHWPKFFLYFIHCTTGQQGLGVGSLNGKPETKVQLFDWR